MHPHAILSHINWHRGCPATVSADEWIHLKSIQCSSYLYLFLTTNTNFHSFYFLFINFSLVTSVPNSRDSCSCTIAQVVYEGDPARHHGSHFVIVTSGDKDISPRQLVLWHLRTSFYSVKWGKRRRSIAYPWVKLRSYDIIYLQCYMLMFVKLSDWFQLQIWNQDRLRIDLCFKTLIPTGINPPKKMLLAEASLGCFRT